MQHIRTLPPLLDGLIHGIAVYAFLLIVGFVGLAGQMGLGSSAFLVLGVLVPLSMAAIYLSVYRYRIRIPRRWSTSWWTLYHTALATMAVLYFTSGMLIYGRTYLWYDVVVGTLFIAFMMVVVEMLSAMLSNMSLYARVFAIGVSVLLLAAMVGMVS